MPRTRTRAAKQPITATRGRRTTFRVLVATAGDEESRAAIAFTSALAPRLHATVDVLTVVVPFPHRISTGFTVAPPPVIDEDNRQAAVAEVRAQLRSVRGTGKWRLDSALGWPAETIPIAAARTRASLIVIGAGDHGFIDRLVGSETAVGIARRTHVPVLAVPAKTRGLPTNALAAVDFTDSSIASARLAARLLGTGGRLTLLHSSMFIANAPDAGSFVDVYTAGAEAKLARLADEIHHETRISVDTLVVPGQVVPTILGQVKRLKCGLLAIGGHAMSLLDRMMVGSVRAKVLRRAPCPVLIAPASEEPPG